MKRKILAAILVLGMLASLLAGCGGKGGKMPAAAQKRADANEIAIGIAQDLDDSLDPHVASVFST